MKTKDTVIITLGTVFVASMLIGTVENYLTNRLKLKIIAKYGKTIDETLDDLIAESNKQK